MKKSLLFTLGVLLTISLASCGGGGSNQFTVTFKNYDQTVLGTDSVEKGGTAVYTGATPTKPSDENYTYTYRGWDASLENIQANCDRIAQYISTAIGEIDDYDKWVDTWSEEGHLYIHYMRPGAASEDYNDYAVWIWQNAPQDLEGSLWGASLSSVRDNFYEMSTSWMTTIGDSNKSADQSGRVMDIDLYKAGLVGGKTGRATTFEGATRVGFLIVKQDSMDGGTHWTSDGGANTYISYFDTHFRDNDSMHIYCTQGSLSDFTFYYDGIAPENPVVTDETGDYRSESDVTSSTTTYGKSSTSDEFQELGIGYQIFVASFRDSDNNGIGDLRGVINSLDYLDNLGVQCLWLTPIQSSNSYHGYDVTDFYEVDSKFGTIEDYRELLYKAHQKGMKVLMDLVLNHTSKNNVWFQKSQKAATGTDEFGNSIDYRNMYHWKFEDDLVKQYVNGKYVDVKVQNHPDWYKDGESKYYYYGKFGSSMAELNYDCQATRDLVTNMATYWMSFGLDGFRLDAVKHIYMKDEVSDTGSDIVISDVGERTYYDSEKMEQVTVNYDYSSDMTKNINFWKEFANRLKSVNPSCFLVGENFDGWGQRMAGYYQALDSQFDFSLYYHNLEWAYLNSDNQNAAKYGATQQTETYNNFKSSGTATINGVSVPLGGRSDFINGAFTSNHDVNRAINHINATKDSNNLEVNPTITGTDAQINRAKVHAAMTLLQPGISWIYYGDELGMSGNTNEHIEKYQYANNVDLWYRQPFKWSDENAVTGYSFNGYTVEWDDYNKTSKVAPAEEQASSATNGDMYDMYKALTTIKKQYGKNATYTGYTFSGNNDVMHFNITSNNGTFSVYINCGRSGQSASISTSGTVTALNGATVGGSLPAYGVIVCHTA